MSNLEENNYGPEREHNPEAIKEAGAERLKELHEQHEKAKNAPENLENARHEVEQINAEREKKAAEHEQRAASPAERRNNGPIGARERDASFNTTMKDVRAHMSPSSRAFSKVIHNKAVEKISDVGASTIARPNAILSGAIFAFALTLGVYLVAKNLGYPLSGFETIGAFVLGWVLGIAYDFLKVMITGRK